MLKAELGNALLQIMVPSGRAFGPGDGIMAKLGLSLPLEMAVGGVEDLWRVSGRPPPSSEPPGPGPEHAELLNVLDALGAKKSQQKVAVAALGADGTEAWDPNGGPRSKARRRIGKAAALRDGGWRAFLEPRRKRRR